MKGLTGAVAHIMRAIEQIRAEVEQTFGFFPPFFEPALPSPQVLESLWQQTKAAYIESPLPALFNERLNASLSRFCVVPYCMVCHSSALRPMGMTAGQVLSLLDKPEPTDSDFDGHLTSLGETPILLSDFPAPDSTRELALIACTTALFLEKPEAEQCRDRLAQVLGADLFNSLSLYLAYIKTCHLWVETHPEISYEADVRVQNNLMPLLADEPALQDFFRSYQQQLGIHRFNREERRLADNALRTAEAQTAQVLERITDAFFALDTAWMITYVNDQTEQLVGQAREALLGQTFRNAFPDAIASAFEKAFQRAVAQQTTVTFEEFFPFLDKWFEVRAYPSAEGLSVFCRNVTDRKQREADRQERARLASLAADVGRALTTRATLAEMLNGCAEAIVNHLDAAFARVWTLDEFGTVLVLRASAGQYTHLNGPHGRVPVGKFKIGQIAQERKPHLTNTVIDDPRVSDQEWAIREGMVAFAGYPLEVEDRLIGVVALFARQPLSGMTLQALGSVADQISLGVERKSSEEAAQGANRRIEVILESITDAFYAVDGQFRFTHVNHKAEALWGREREDFLGRPFLDVLPEAAGSYSYAQHERALAERMPIHYETLSSVSSRWIEVSIFPTADGGLSVFFRDIGERKALEAEREKLAEREHRIAEQLQTALQPDTPDRVPGMALADYYRPAWEDQGVGGDFSDTFSTDKGVTFLVVGDLSGKGLAAASQVAMVRNMLRFALYNGRTVAGPVSSLNATLADNGLVNGFTTLFVGRYDAHTRALTYVNCGQDAGLVLRAASGQIESLSPTGAVLGAISGAVYTEETVTLETSDVLALFTDGLTEAGPNRSELLTGDGVADLLKLQAGLTDPHAITQRLMAGIDAYAGAGIRDDQCLLVGVVTEPGVY